MEKKRVWNSLQSSHRLHKEKRKLTWGVILFLILLAIFSFFVYYTMFKFYSQRGIDDENFISNIRCDATTKCPSGMSCLKFPEKSGPICASLNLNSYYECPPEQKPVIIKTFPGQVVCK